MAEKQTAKRNRREEILQSLALMLESSDGSQRITTAKLAASVGVSEAELYRHFPSKTRMFERNNTPQTTVCGRCVDACLARAYFQGYFVTW